MNETSLRGQFFNDSLDVLADAEEYVLQLENEGFHKDTVHSLFRLFHTLKGNSNMVGEGEISSLTHALESQYDAVRNMKIELSEELLQSTFEVIDLLNMVCQEGDSAAHKDRLVEMTNNFDSPLKRGEGDRGKGRSEASSSASKSAAAGQAGGAGRSAAEAGIDLGSDVGSRETAQAEPTGPAMASTREREELGSFRQWRPILKAFYNLEGYALAMADPESEEDWEDTLMELGLAAIELRSAVDEASEHLDRLAVYLEKTTSTLSREQIPYSEISYELLFILLNDFRRRMWERLYILGIFKHYRIDSVEALDEVIPRLEDEHVLYVVELAIKEEAFLRESPLFGKIEKVKQAAPQRVVLIGPRMRLMQKATALLDQALEGFPQIAMDIEEGVRRLLLTEE